MRLTAAQTHKSKDLEGSQGRCGNGLSPAALWSCRRTVGVAGTGEALSFPRHFQMCGCPQIKVPSVGKQVWKRLTLSDNSAGELGSKAMSPEVKHTFTATLCTLSFWWINCEMSHGLGWIWTQGLSHVVSLFSLSFLKVCIPEAELSLPVEMGLAQVLESLRSLSGCYLFCNVPSQMCQRTDLCMLQNEAKSRGKRVQGSLLCTVQI